MRVGEKAILTCPPETAYGSKGAGGVIPPNATLTFEVELFKFDAPKPAPKFEKIISREGSGPLCPKGAKCVMHYHGTLMDGSVFDSSVKRGKPFECQIGVGQVIKGWDEGVTTMKKGEKATLICPPDYAYGSRGAGGVIPANATLKFDVELIDFK